MVTGFGAFFAPLPAYLGGVGVGDDGVLDSTSH
jgi:hypothetical protein